MPADHKHGNFGKVPSYLKERNAELAGREAQRRAAAEAELIPEGRFPSPESPRLAAHAAYAPLPARDWPLVRQMLSPPRIGVIGR
eukprot:211352-Prorocentrum_minimum.AAC.1